MESEFQHKRRKALSFLSSEYNRVMHNAVFDEDYDRAEQYKSIIELLQALSYNHFKAINRCPVCGSEDVSVAKLEKVRFVNNKTKRVKRVKVLRIKLCNKCGYMMPVSNPHG